MNEESEKGGCVENSKREGRHNMLLVLDFLTRGRKSPWNSRGNQVETNREGSRERYLEK